MAPKPFKFQMQTRFCSSLSTLASASSQHQTNGKIQYYPRLNPEWPLFWFSETSEHSTYKFITVTELRKINALLSAWERESLHYSSNSSLKITFIMKLPLILPILYFLLWTERHLLLIITSDFILSPFRARIKSDSFYILFSSSPSNLSILETCENAGTKRLAQSQALGQLAGGTVFGWVLYRYPSSHKKPK